jgi:hypothetical protein
MDALTSRRAALVALALTSAGCERRRGDRCAHCGMRVPEGSRWRAGATRPDGSALHFDTPGCLLRYRFTPAGRGLREPWVIEHYGPATERVDARRVRFIAGSRVRGPMGDDWIPVTPASVERFRRDHGGREGRSFDEVTPEALAAQ